MKLRVLFVLCTTLFVSCIPVKNVQDINGYHIIEGNKKVGKDLKSQNVFSFQIYKDRRFFDRYLYERFHDVPGFSSSEFNVEIEDVPFTIRILSKEETSTYLDFTDYIFKNDDPELVKNGKKKQFIYMVVKDENNQDALSTDSFYRYIVAKYLDEIRMDFKAY
ncbi:hypothetical protein Q4512_02925 [Oceanihabitans sp. 2_MG-2023]|uniref:hypothetical protein n=1 Tax=Oceanihabitans sp. 2_MG-2023 TaxID=3062661 RepID=UPI0026E1BD53|nr:hypothetical protein [Oceanihabitans sp. 2_MG-2023]MDO6595850.1 hypothetical protein [Oceanihabitans sp. 2_MG-2023]